MMIEIERYYQLLYMRYHKGKMNEKKYSRMSDKLGEWDAEQVRKRRMIKRGKSI